MLGRINIISLPAGVLCRRIQLNENVITCSRSGGGRMQGQMLLICAPQVLFRIPQKITSERIDVKDFD